jgi:hypothetical protein
MSTAYYLMPLSEQNYFISMETDTKKRKSKRKEEEEENL